jgi:hypothetical protein
VSLAANIASASTLTWQPVLVAGWPPVALLLAVELLAHRPHHRERAETETAVESGTEIGLASVAEEPVSDRRPTAEEVMWEHYTREATRGRAPTGAELDRVAGTNNFGRAVLRRWRRAGLLPDATVLDWTPRLDGETATETGDETEAAIS